MKSRTLNAKRGEVFIFSGPVAIKVLSGLIAVSGREVKEEEEVIIPKGENAFIETLTDSVLNYRLGEGGDIKTLERTMPIEWRTVLDSLKEVERVRALLLGSPVLGRSLLATYIINVITSTGSKVGFINLDIEQPDIGPPATVSVGIAEKPVSSLKELKIIDGFFIGSITFRGQSAGILTGLIKMFTFLNKSEDIDSLIMSVGGPFWGKEGRTLIDSIIRIAEPNRVIVIEKGDELEHLIKPISKTPGLGIMRVPAPYIQQLEGGYEYRRGLYMKYLSDVKKRVFYIDDIMIRGGIYGSGHEPPSSRYEEILNIVGYEKLTYIEESSDATLIILKESLDESKISALKSLYKGKEMIIRYEGYEKGLLVGLYDREGKYLGIGIIDSIDYKRGRITLWSSAEEVFIIQLGHVKLSLDEEMKEELIEGFII